MAAIAIRRVDPAVERERILAVLADNLPAAAGRERFDWLYLCNPAGPALVWLAEDDTGQPLATSAAHRRRMHVGGETVDALVLGDFAVARSQRSLGVALRLLRATLDPVRAGAYAFSYDYCNAPMQAVYRRMGLAPLGANERRMRPVTLRRLVRAKLGGGAVAELLGIAGDVALRAGRLLRRTPKQVRIEPITAACGEEFDTLDTSSRNDRFAAGVRSAAYLNWHYLGNPIWQHEILAARVGGRLAGYATLRWLDRDAASIVDLQADEQPVRGALLSAALERSREREVAAIHAEVLSASPSAALFHELGFLRRESSAGPVLFLSPGCPHATKLASVRSWWLMGGDRDV